MTEKPTIYFVLKGLLNGEDGMHATTTFNTLQEDGWYYVLDGYADGMGPWPTRQRAAQEGAEAHRESLEDEWQVECLNGLNLSVLADRAMELGLSFEQYRAGITYATEQGLDRIEEMWAEEFTK